MTEYAYSTNEEDFHRDIEDIYGSVLCDFDNEEDLRNYTYYRGEIWQPQPSTFFRLDWLYEQIEGQAYDEFGEYAENYLDSLTPEKNLEFEKLISNWLDENLKPTCFTVRNVVPMKFTEEEIQDLLNN